MGYVYRIEFPDDPEQIAYALSWLGVQEIRNIAEKNEHRCHWRKLKLCSVPASELDIVKSLAR
jgi:hypothetical protein